MSAISFSKVASLIRGYSMPNTDLWTLLPGKVKKSFNNYAKAQAYIAKRHQTDTDDPSKLSISCVLKYTIASTCINYQRYRYTCLDKFNSTSFLHTPQNLQFVSCPSKISISSWSLKESRITALHDNISLWDWWDQGFKSMKTFLFEMWPFLHWAFHQIRKQ